LQDIVESADVLGLSRQMMGNDNGRRKRNRQPRQKGTHRLQSSGGGGYHDHSKRRLSACAGMIIPGRMYGSIHNVKHTRNVWQRTYNSEIGSLAGELRSVITRHLAPRLPNELKLRCLALDYFATAIIAYV
jgi:hypothetical protein